MSSFEPGKGADQMQACEEVASGFFVAGCDAPELFDKIEEAFDQIAFGVEDEVAMARDLAIRFWRMTGSVARTSRVSIKASTS